MLVSSEQTDLPTTHSNMYNKTECFLLSFAGTVSLLICIIPTSFRAAILWDRYLVKMHFCLTTPYISGFYMHVLRFTLYVLSQCVL